MADRFQVNVQVEIVKIQEHGGYTGERMSVREDFAVGFKTFTELAGILGQFYDLAERIKEVE